MTPRLLWINILIVLMITTLNPCTAQRQEQQQQDTSKSLESTGVVRQVYRSGNAPPPALAPDMNDGAGDYMVSTAFYLTE
jgi:hypothetical protein